MDVAIDGRFRSGALARGLGSASPHWHVETAHDYAVSMAVSLSVGLGIFLVLVVATPLLVRRCNVRVPSFLLLLAAAAVITCANLTSQSDRRITADMAFMLRTANATVQHASERLGQTSRDISSLEATKAATVVNILSLVGTVKADLVASATQIQSDALRIQADLLSIANATNTAPYIISSALFARISSAIAEIPADCDKLAADVSGALTGSVMTLPDGASDSIAAAFGYVAMVPDPQMTTNWALMGCYGFVTLFGLMSMICAGSAHRSYQIAGVVAQVLCALLLLVHLVGSCAIVQACLRIDEVQLATARSDEQWARVTTTCFAGGNVLDVLLGHRNVSSEIDAKFAAAALFDASVNTTLAHQTFGSSPDASLLAQLNSIVAPVVFVSANVTLFQPASISRNDTRYMAAVALVDGILRIDAAQQQLTRHIDDLDSAARAPGARLQKARVELRALFQPIATQAQALLDSAVCTPLQDDYGLIKDRMCGSIVTSLFASTIFAAASFVGSCFMGALISQLRRRDAYVLVAHSE